MMGKNKWSLNCIIMVMKMGREFRITTWWKCILGITSNLIFKPLSMDMICMGLSMDSLCYQ
jgi:hypothetical protein